MGGRDSAVPDWSSRRRFQDMERRMDRLEKRLNEPLRRPGVNHEVVFRLAQTVADPDDDPTYPAHPANTFKIAFIDAEFTATAGEQDMDINSRVGTASPYQTLGRTINGMWLPEGHVVGCLYQTPLDATKGYHWLLPIGGGGVGFLGYGDTITARSGTTPGSGTVELFWRNPTSGLLESLGASITIYNCTQQTPFSSEVYIQWKLDLFGTFWWDVDDCFTA